MSTRPEPASAADELFHIYLTSETEKKEPYLEVDDSTNSGAIISKLPSKSITTKGKPEPNTATELDDSDQSVKWLKNIDDAGKFSLTIKPGKKREHGETEEGGGDEDEKKTEIIQFDFEFREPSTFKFSSESSVLKKAFGDAAKDIQEPGFDDPRLYLGLKESDSKEIPLATAWTYTGLSEGSIPKFLKGLQVKPDVKLATGHRNALWINPEASLRVTVRLVFGLASLDTLNSLGLSALKINFTEADLICRKVVSAGKSGGETVPVKQGNAALSIGCKFSSPSQELDAEGVMEFAEDTISMTLLSKSEDPIAGALSWLEGLLGLENNELGFVTDLLHKEPFQGVQFRRIKLLFDTEVKVKLKSFKLDVQVSSSIGQDPQSDKKSLFLLSYTYNSSAGGLGTIRGELWEDSGITNPTLNPTYETWTDLEPFPAGTSLPPLQIKYLIPGQTIDDIPHTVPDTIERAFITLSAKEVGFGATVKAKEVSPGAAPQPYLGQIKLDASFQWDRSDFKFDLYVMTGIVPPSGSAHKDPALLTGSLMYQRSKTST
ncbi:hypothetical protein BGW36DRAFT_463605 [Talaromyces proteolyticus]|uniref:Uncharacterized protein n=1 Tax=Talaromyces proteolyticus TaxID=1131652 RepID=A0AAD4KRH7_9EURO|nr:uncharacterized protein BGW36DRAFT_463605 [Talaromyces proteolyticus]KAH8693992.1 hypothetical protein BGW36DRAFT_463605 [Talaromyces proteolyticus]